MTSTAFSSVSFSSVSRFHSVQYLPIWVLVQCWAYRLHPSPAGLPFLQWNFGHHPHSSGCFRCRGDNCCVHGVSLLPTDAYGKPTDVRIRHFDVLHLENEAIQGCRFPCFHRYEPTTQSSAFCFSCRWSSAFCARWCSSAGPRRGHAGSSRRPSGSALSFACHAFKWRQLWSWQRSARPGPAPKPSWSGSVPDSREEVSASSHPYR